MKLIEKFVLQTGRNMVKPKLREDIKILQVFLPAQSENITGNLSESRQLGLGWILIK